jgi:maleylpyruvate isomerase
MKLYNHALSSASYRARIALNLKGLDYDQVLLDLRGGEQRGAEFRAINPQGLVPALVDGEVTLSQSLAIIEYLDETHPEPPLLPADPVDRARVRALSLVVACDIHPLNNLKVLSYLTRDLGLSDETRDRWYHHWIAEGLSALEAMVAGHPATGRFCHGDSPTLADVCLVPQLANARRFDCDISGYPTLLGIDEACQALPAFARAHPSQQQQPGAG